ncbi:hypothetical protein RHGRI_021544 [Rhododendron griersonianum]|uniref:Uncharacterized protein n=1 Tax=Rhododendron griersonianum TaxID=479676 RepID=A0AAV6JQ35_9ERIC|nr:hypothetical protein RHGRI_021544 [Rhododendron griersonianum]
MPQSLAFEADALSPKRMLSFPSNFSLKEDVELLNPKEAVMNPPPVAPTPTIVQKIISELMGTYIFVFVGCASALAHRDDAVKFPIEATAMVWGLSFMVLKYALAHISGAFMNPASSIAFAVVKKLPWKNVPIFIVAQITGSILASLNLRILFHNQPDIRPAVTQVVSPYTPLQAVFWEYTITFILTIISSAVATDSRAHKMLFGVAIGATVVFNVVIAGDISGAAMNPARSIGPAVVAGEYKDLWVYIIGPLLGATTATLIVAELLGTYIFMFVGCASALAYRENPLTIVGTAMVWGLALMVVKYTLGHISGAYVNPAATIRFAVARWLPWKHAPSYILAQLIGSTLACLNLRVLFYHQPDIKPALTQYSSSTTPLQAVAWECIITFLLSFTSSGVATDHRAHKMLSGVAIGATLAFNIIVAGEITGAAMNPARSIGPAIVADEYKDVWVYVVGPVLGTATATLVYGVLRVPEPKKSKESTKIIIYVNELYTEPSYDTTQLGNIKNILNVV